MITIVFLYSHVLWRDKLKNYRRIIISYSFFEISRLSYGMKRHLWDGCTWTQNQIRNYIRSVALTDYKSSFHLIVPFHSTHSWLQAQLLKAKERLEPTAATVHTFSKTAAAALTLSKAAAAALTLSKTAAVVLTLSKTVAADLTLSKTAAAGVLTSLSVSCSQHYFNASFLWSPCQRDVSADVHSIALWCYS